METTQTRDVATQTRAVATQTRDVIVIGSSMGGIEALSMLVRQLPGELPAAVFVVQHLAPESPGLLGQILSWRGTLPAVTAQDGMPLERGRIYVAPPDRHLLATAQGVRVVFGPRENRSRPAIDPLFRTAAVNYRSRVIGVILTGLLSDGAAGLLAVQRCGGATVVQAPEDAAYPEMPKHALAMVDADHRVALSELGTLLLRLVAAPAPEPPAVPEALRIEARLTERAIENEEWHQVPGTPTNFTCPECRGALQEVHEPGASRYRCRVGHAYSQPSWLAEKGQAVEASLWVALQTLQERAQMLENMAREERERGRPHGAAVYEERARETREHAGRLLELVTHLPE
jgi:two-component system, chemotaxis family, protein-glutamate methylesterase/glutaminase